MRFQSEKHDRIVSIISNKLNGKRTDNFNLEKGKTYPDVITADYDVEVEMLTSSSLRNKCKKYETSRRRRLVIAIPDEILKHFEEVTLWV